MNYLGNKPSSLPNCSGDVVLEILSRNYSSGCSHSMPFYHKEYDIVEEYHHYDDSLLADESMVYLRYNSDHLEEHQNSFIRVDEQTLIGHIGGLFGITLGWSSLDRGDSAYSQCSLLICCFLLRLPVFVIFDHILSCVFML
jgi:hypothetical protein